MPRIGCQMTQPTESPRDLPSNQRWIHLILHTRNTWLHGDVRGFRSREHRIHSSGDYRNPPPPDEHRNLRAFMVERSGDSILLGSDGQLAVLDAVRVKLDSLGSESLAIAVAPTHLHGLISAPCDQTLTNKLIAKLKQRLSYVCAESIARPVWAQGECIKTIRVRQHQVATFVYITEKQEASAMIWSFRNPGHRFAHPSASKRNESNRMSSHDSISEAEG